MTKTYQSAETVDSPEQTISPDDRIRRIIGPRIVRDGKATTVTQGVFLHVCGTYHRIADVSDSADGLSVSMDRAQNKAAALARRLMAVSDPETHAPADVVRGRPGFRTSAGEAGTVVSLGAYLFDGRTYYRVADFSATVDGALADRGIRREKAALHRLADVFAGKVAPRLIVEAKRFAEERMWKGMRGWMP